MSRTFVAVGSPDAGVAAIWRALLVRPQLEAIRVTGLTKAEAQELLDWLEANGYTGSQLDYTAETGFAVHYRARARGQ
jgi:hypothetical protein